MEARDKVVGAKLVSPLQISLFSSARLSVQRYIQFYSNPNHMCLNLVGRSPEMMSNFICAIMHMHTPHVEQNIECGAGALYCGPLDHGTVQYAFLPFL